MRDAVIFDRDGTLASVAHCAPQSRDNASWANYNAALPFDAPVPVVAGLFRAVRPGIVRIITTGRMDNMRPQMSDWLHKHDLTPNLLLMRRFKDNRVDSVVKQEMLDWLRQRFNILFVVDDRPQVVDMWRDNGLAVLAVKDPGILPPICK